MTYTLVDGSVTIKSYSGSAASLVIPGTVDGYTVTVVGKEAFMNNTTLTSIDLPDSITLLAEKCFYGCKNLKEMK